MEFTIHDINCSFSTFVKDKSSKETFEKVLSLSLKISAAVSFGQNFFLKKIHLFIYLLWWAVVTVETQNRSNIGD